MMRVRTVLGSAAQHSAAGVASLKESPRFVCECIGLPIARSLRANFNLNKL